MNLAFASIVMFAWIPVCTMFFAFVRPLRALTLAYLIGWLLLPVGGVEIEGFWDVDKILATNIGVSLGMLLFCARQFRGYRIGVADVLVAAFAAGTCITSLTNDLGMYDGVSSLTHKCLYYAAPFVFGRAIIRSERDLVVAARIVVVGAAMYAVLAVWEWRMSPQIHEALYGVFQHSWSQHARWGFYRPIVCFPMALGLGIFMTWTSVLALAMYRARQLPRPFDVPPWVLVALPLTGVLVSMSLGPWIMLILGVGMLLIWNRAHRRWVVWLPVLFALFWMVGRYTQVTDGAFLTNTVAKISADRAESLEYRVYAEDLLLERARTRSAFGWGGWGRNRVTDAEGHDLVATDGLWIILVGSYGLVGLTCFYLWWCWPVLLSAACDARLEHSAVVVALLIAIGIQAVNLLFNGFVSPILTMLSGGAVTVMLELSRAQRPVAMADVVERPVR